MPYSGQRQRAFFHTEAAKKAGITASEVKEFDKASKGLDLPKTAKSGKPSFKGITHKGDD